jgi:hypothetical protein
MVARCESEWSGPGYEKGHVQLDFVLEGVSGVLIAMEVSIEHTTSVDNCS